MSEYAKNIQKIDDMWKKRIELPKLTEIVRCRDCKHYMDYEHEYEPNLGYCRFHDMEEVRDSQFCAWGERK